MVAIVSDRLVYVKKVFVDRLSILTDMVEANFSMFVRAYRNGRPMSLLCSL